VCPPVEPSPNNEKVHRQVAREGINPPMLAINDIIMDNI